MIYAVIIMFTLIVCLLVALVQIDIRLSVLEALVEMLCTDRMEFYKTWERMKEEVDDH